MGEDVAPTALEVQFNRTYAPLLAVVRFVLEEASDEGIAVRARVGDVAVSGRLAVSLPDCSDVFPQSEDTLDSCDEFREMLCIFQPECDCMRADLANQESNDSCRPPALPAVHHPGPNIQIDPVHMRYAEKVASFEKGFHEFVGMEDLSPL